MTNRYRPPLAAVAVGALLLVGCSGDPGAGEQAGATTERSEASPDGSIDGSVDEPSRTPSSGDDEQAGSGSVESASGSGVATYAGDRYPFEVIACGWMSDSTDAEHLQLSGERNRRQLFQIAGVGRDGDGLFLIGLTWAGQGNIEATVAHDGTPRFMASSGLNPASALEIDGGRIRTLRRLTVYSGPAEPQPLEVDAACDRFGGSMGEMVELLEEATGRQVTTPDERGGGGTLTVDGQEITLQIDSCDQREERIIVEATAADGTWLYLYAAERGDDEVVVGLEGDATGADATGDLITVEGDRLRSTQPIDLSDRVDDTPAQTVTFDVACGASG